MARLNSSVWLLSFVLVACANGNCRQIQSQEQAPKIVAANTAAPSAADMAQNDIAATRRILVYKNDGSLQCQQGVAQPVEEMALQLKAIKVFSGVNKSDGRMHVQVCGTPTGKVNVYEILESDLAKAQKKGFKLWNFD